ncbi:glycan biosynthesis hexose transferase WsfD [Actinophytocola sediminis]
MNPVRTVTRTADWLPAVLGGLLAAGSMAVRQLAGTPVGMANNGDAARLMCQVGADSGNAHHGADRWDFVRFAYAELPIDAPCPAYRTSQYLQLRLSSWLHDLLGLPGALDMRLVIVQDCVLAGVAVGTMVWLLRRTRWWVRVGVPAALFLVLADATFAGHAASPFSEPAAFIGLVTVALAGVAAVGGTRRRTAFLIATAGAALAVSAKLSAITLAVPFALFLVTRRLPLWRGSWGLPVVGVAAIASAAVWVSGTETSNYERVNVANTITMTIMPQSADPAGVATDLGLPASFGQYSGTHWWSRPRLPADPEFAANAHHLTRTNLGRYLLDNPAAVVRMVTGGADEYLAYRVDYLGSYGEFAGRPPGSQECRLCLLPTVSRALAWTGFAGVAGYWLLCLVAAGAQLRRSAPGTLRRGFALVAMTLVGVAVVQYLTAVLGEGNEITKHLSVALLAATLAPVWLLAGLFASGGDPELVESEQADRDVGQLAAR